jgi:hypothetical protein
MTLPDLKIRIPRATALIAALGLTTAAFGVLSVDPATNVAVGTQPSGLAAGDFDGDGDRDLVTTVDGSDSVAICDLGGATFARQQVFATGFGPEQVICADIDGAGGPDVVVANGRAAFLSVVVNCAEFSQPGDVTGDGVVGILDLLALLAAWGQCPRPCPPSCAADFDGDC